MVYPDYEYHKSFTKLWKHSVRAKAGLIYVLQNKWSIPTAWKVTRLRFLQVGFEKAYSTAPMTKTLPIRSVHILFVSVPSFYGSIRIFSIGPKALMLRGTVWNGYVWWNRSRSSLDAPCWTKNLNEHRKWTIFSYVLRDSLLPTNQMKKSQQLLRCTWFSYTNVAWKLWTYISLGWIVLTFYFI